MPSYLVELYVPRRNSIDREALVRAARQVGPGYVRSIFLDDEETCFHEYESASAGALIAALAQSAVRYERLIEATVVA